MFFENQVPHVLTNSRLVHVPPNSLKLHWDKPEDVMNKVMAVVVIAGGLMLMNSPEATAHQTVHNVYQPPTYYQSYGRIDERRPDHMPSWMKRDKSFRHWYNRTSLKHNRRLDWHELFNIYRWERSWRSSNRRNGNYWDKYYAYRYGERHYDRDRSRRDERRHRH
jgi:hypothetical protein